MMGFLWRRYKKKSFRQLEPLERECNQLQLPQESTKGIEKLNDLLDVLTWKSNASVIKLKQIKKQYYIILNKTEPRGVKSSQVKPSQVKSSHTKSSQVKSCQVY